MAESVPQKHLCPRRDVVVLAIALFAFMAAPALGASVTQAPQIAGDRAPGPGSELVASPGSWTPASATATYDWLRCDASGTAATRCPALASAATRSGTPTSGTGCASGSPSPMPGQPHAFGISEPTWSSLAQAVFDPDPGRLRRAPASRSRRPGRDRARLPPAARAGRGTTPAPTTSLPFIDPFPIVRISDGSGAGAPSSRASRSTRRAVPASAWPAKAAAVPTGAGRSPCGSSGCGRCSAPTGRTRRSRSASHSRRRSASTRASEPARARAPRRIDRCLRPGKTRPVKCPTA